MTNGRKYEAPATYQIRVKGRLDPTWSDWFDGFTVDDQQDETLLTGTVTDQAALHGLLARINDLGLVLVSIRKLPDR